MAFSFILKSSLKLGIVGGAVYATIDRGLWGNSQQTIDAYNKLKSYVPKEYIESVTDKVKVENPIEGYLQEYMKKSVKDYWNSGVLCAFYGLSVLPCKISHYSKVAWDKANAAISDSTPVSASK